MSGIASMHGASRGALQRSRQQLVALVAGDQVDGGKLGDELFAVAGLLDGHGSLRRGLTDPSRSGDVKASLLQRVLGSQLDGPTLDLVSGLVRERWSQTRDLADAIEELAAMALITAAQRHGRLDALEDELFRFGRILAGDRELQHAFGRRDATPERKEQLTSRLLGDQVGPESLRLARQAAARPRGQGTAQTLDLFGQLAARQRERLVGRVTAALPLTEQQRDRLAGVLHRWYGREVHLDVEVDPDVLGGLRVQVGDELVDATVFGRLDGARRRLAG